MESKFGSDRLLQSTRELERCAQPNQCPARNRSRHRQGVAMTSFLLKPRLTLSPVRNGNDKCRRQGMWLEPCEPRILFSGPSDVQDLTEPPDTGVHVYAPHAKVEGQTLGEWSARWWQWATSGTTETNPLVDLTGEDAGSNQPKNVFFLAGRRGAGSVERTITVPSGSKLFFPVLNVSFITFPTDPPMPASELRPLLDGVVGGYSGLYATVDGRGIDVGGHRE